MNNSETVADRMLKELVVDERAARTERNELRHECTQLRDENKRLREENERLKHKLEEAIGRLARRMK